MSLSIKLGITFQSRIFLSVLATILSLGQLLAQESFVSSSSVDHAKKTRAVYTIGSDGADYTSFADAITYLESQAPISEAWVFQVQDGAYNEKVTINEISGASLTNTITFESVSGDSSMVTISSDDASSTLDLNGADYITFRSISIHNSNDGRGVNFLGGADYNSFEHCKISVTNDKNVFNLEDGANLNNTFLNNRIVGGNYGFVASDADNITIKDNYLENQNKSSIKLSFLDTYSIENNRIYSVADQIYGKALILYHCTSGEVINNLIWCYGDNNTSLSAVDISSITDLYFYYNTIYTLEGHVIDIGASTGIDIRNNLFYNKSKNAGIYSLFSETATIDYNAYYYLADWFGTSSGAIANLSDWQTATGYDMHSKVINPAFVSSDELVPQSFPMDNMGTPIVGYADDFSGAPRDPATPDVGAFEYTSDFISYMAGTYTIGVSGADYTGIHAALDEMAARGIDGDVVFEIKDGTYEETLDLVKQDYYYNQPDAWLTLKSSSNDSSKVWIKGTGNVDYMHQVFDFSKLKITQLGFDDTNNESSEIDLFRVRGYIDSLEFSHNYTLSEGTGSYVFIDYWESNAVDSLKHLVLKNNNSGGGRGLLSVYGASENLKVLGNVFEGGYIGNNTYSNDTISGNIVKDISLENGSRAVIEKNILSGKLFLINNQEVASPVLVRNNYVKNDREWSYTLLELRNGAGYQVYNNTFYQGTVYFNNADDAEFLNNIVINKHNSTALSISFDTENLASDYNNLFSLHEVLINDGTTDYSTLSEWQLTGQDVNSVSFYSEFEGEYDYHVLSPVCNNAGTPLPEVAEDLEGELRDPVNPDIGADEYEGCSTPLLGDYTVETGGVYTTIGEALEDVRRCGIGGDVNLLLGNETFSEQVELQKIYRTDEQAWLNIQSAEMDTAKTIWKTSTADEDYVLKMNATNNLRIQGIQFHIGKKYSLLLENEPALIEVDSCLFAISPENDGQKHISGTIGDSVNITNNAILDAYYGMDLSMTDSSKALLVAKNYIRASDGAFFRHVFNLDFSQNRVESEFIGLFLQYTKGTNDYPTLITNNYIFNELGQSIYCMDINHGKIWYNTLVSKRKAFEYETGSVADTANESYNNIFYSLGNPAIHCEDIYGLESDYNLIYADGDYLCEDATTTYATLEDWQIASGMEAHSLSFEPYFTDDSYHTNHIPLNGKAIPLSAVTIDMDGEPRDETHPDIGADEFEPDFTLLDDTTICAYNSVVLEAPDGFDTYSWSTGATERIIEVDSTGVGVGLGTYTCTVTIGGDEYEDAMDVDFTLPVFPLEDIQGCTGDSILFIYDGEATAYWYADFAEEVIGDSLLITPFDSRTFSYRIELEDERGCINREEAEIDISYTPGTPVLFYEAEGRLKCPDVFYDLYNWYLDGELLKSTTENIITMEVSGEYQLAVTRNNCTSDLSDGYNYNVGIDEGKSKLLEIFPNPAKDVVYISYDGVKGNTTFALYDLTGKIRMHGQFNSEHEYQLNLKDIPTGIYYLQLVADEQQFTRKLIVE